jgi:alpha-tubulin suppressor-like RCC1 family protein
MIDQPIKKQTFSALASLAVCLALAGIQPGCSLLVECEETPARWLDISAGDNHTCAVREDNTVWCWGGDEYGELGNLESLSPCEFRKCSSVPVQVSDLYGVDFVAGGSDHNCAIGSGGTTWCWGRNDSGQLGLGSNDGPDMCDSTPCALTPEQNTDNFIHFVSIAPGLTHTCGANRNGRLYCWGDNGQGMLGNGTNDPDYTTDGTQVLEGVAAVDVGMLHTCAVSGGDVYCWGANTGMQVGPSSVNDATPCVFQANNVPCARSPRLVAGISNAVDVAVGQGHSCALKDDQTVWCWGWDEVGQLGVGDTTQGNCMRSGQPVACSDTPIQVQGLGPVLSISVRQASACVIVEDGSVWCWGVNGDGLLGRDPETGPEFCPVVDVPDPKPCSRLPVRIEGLPPAATLTISGFHGCILTEEGEAWCWGRNEHGNLGDGTTERRLRPVRVKNP